jgi:hypothetical protein
MATGRLTVRASGREILEEEDDERGTPVHGKDTNNPSCDLCGEASYFRHCDVVVGPLSPCGVVRRSSRSDRLL